MYYEIKKEKKMGLGDYATEIQKQKIYSLVYELEIKKASTKHKDIYESHINDSEYWQGLADRVTSKLLTNNICDGFSLKNGGYYLELCDDYSKIKYKVYKSGNVEGPFEHTPSEGCYVATCVYGSYDCPPVWTLRRFRDNFLSRSIFGRWFIKLYYATSPTAVRLFGNKMWFHKLFKAPLDKLVKKLQEIGVESTPYDD